jgi:RNA polymerase sigma-70 factor, ECF subfamily
MVLVADHDLVARLREGSNEAAEVLFERHWARAWRSAIVLTGRADLAEEVVQEAFMKAFESLDGFNGRSSFGTWLHRIVVNGALNARRRESRLVLVDPPELSAEAQLPEHDPALISAVRLLSEDRRLLIVLRYWLELMPREIADVLGVREGTVNSRLFRSLEELRHRLEVDDDDR